MKVRVKLFAAARELVGRGEVVVDLPPGATIGDLQRILASDQPALENLLPHALWAVDVEYADESHALNEQSQVALIPPVSGG
jgi:molybdopterin converting factor subunit 1